ncbi:MAG: hypothetical protein ACHEUT_00050 [Corynebacterium pyruviciproducens]|uniref:hypothetical protein n=1 Tax=Corynebacterium pyruviciproducens TaxID=598660 RepID=UPI003982E542
MRTRTPLTLCLAASLTVGALPIAEAATPTPTGTAVQASGSTGVDTEKGSDLEAGIEWLSAIIGGVGVVAVVAALVKFFGELFFKQALQAFSRQ